MATCSGLRLRTPYASSNEEDACARNLDGETEDVATAKHQEHAEEKHQHGELGRNIRAATLPCWLLVVLKKRIMTCQSGSQVDAILILVIIIIILIIIFNVISYYN